VRGNAESPVFVGGGHETKEQLGPGDVHGSEANLGIASWGKIFDHPMVAAAMLDRLLHRGVVFNIDGESYRMRSHRAQSEATEKAVHPPLTEWCQHQPTDTPGCGISMIESGEFPESSSA
jgi:hypothetical protein